VEAATEAVQCLWFVKPKEHTPSQILKALNPWLPKPGVVPAEIDDVVKSKTEKPTPPELKDTQSEAEPSIPQKSSPPDPPPGKNDTPTRSGDINLDLLDKQEGAIRGIALCYARRLPQAAKWDQIFYVLSSQEKNLLKQEERRVRRNRFISLLVAVALAYLTGLNTFDILLSSEASGIPNDWRYAWGGTLLSAFAATAGSSVWHDLLDKVRQAKEPQGPDEGKPGTPEPSTA
jgi:hypothetical protein